MYDKVAGSQSIAQYQVPPVDTKCIDTNEAFEGEPTQAREFKSDDRSGTPPFEALKAIISIAANHKDAFSIMHIDVSRAFLDAKAQNLCWYDYQWRTAWAPTLGNFVCWERVCTAHGMQQAIRSVFGIRMTRSWRYQLGPRSKKFCQERNQVSGMTHGDNFVSNQNSFHQLRVNGKHQNIEQKVAVVKARTCVSARSQTCRRARENPWARARQLRANTSNAWRGRRRARGVGPSSTQQTKKWRNS